MFVWIFITIWVKLLLLINRYFHRISHRIDRQFKPQATPPCSVLNTIKFRKELFSDLMTSCKFMIKWKKHEWNLPIFTILFLHLVFCLKFVIKHFYSLFYRFEYKEFGNFSAQFRKWIARSLLLWLQCVLVFY